MNGNLDKAWYCARTKPKHEHIAAANLLKNLGLEVFNPRLRVERATQRGLQVVDVRPEQNLLLVRGSVPGPKGSVVEIRSEG